MEFVLLILTAIKLAAVAYLLTLSLAAIFGWHQALLTYPFRVGYSSARLLLGVITFGHVRLLPLGKRARRRSARRLRIWGFGLSEWRANRAGAGLSQPPTIWQAGQQDEMGESPAESPPADQPPRVTPIVTAPSSPFSLFDDEDDVPPPIFG